MNNTTNSGGFFEGLTNAINSISQTVVGAVDAFGNARTAWEQNNQSPTNPQPVPVAVTPEPRGNILTRAMGGDTAAMLTVAFGALIVYRMVK